MTFDNSLHMFHVSECQLETFAKMWPMHPIRVYIHEDRMWVASCKTHDLEILHISGGRFSATGKPDKEYSVMSVSHDVSNMARAEAYANGLASTFRVKHERLRPGCNLNLEMVRLKEGNSYVVLIYYMQNGETIYWDGNGWSPWFAERYADEEQASRIIDVLKSRPWHHPQGGSPLVEVVNIPKSEFFALKATSEPDVVAYWSCSYSGLVTGIDGATPFENYDIAEKACNALTVTLTAPVKSPSICPPWTQAFRDNICIYLYPSGQGYMSYSCGGTPAVVYWNGTGFSEDMPKPRSVYLLRAALDGMVALVPKTWRASPPFGLPTTKADSDKHAWVVVSRFGDNCYVMKDGKFVPPALTDQTFRNAEEAETACRDLVAATVVYPSPASYLPPRAYRYEHPNKTISYFVAREPTSDDLPPLFWTGLFWSNAFVRSASRVHSVTQILEAIVRTDLFPTNMVAIKKDDGWVVKDADGSNHWGWVCGFSTSDLVMLPQNRKYADLLIATLQNERGDPHRQPVPASEAWPTPDIVDADDGYAVSSRAGDDTFSFWIAHEADPQVRCKPGLHRISSSLDAAESCRQHILEASQVDHTDLAGETPRLQFHQDGFRVIAPLVASGRVAYWSATGWSRCFFHHFADQAIAEATLDALAYAMSREPVPVDVNPIKVQETDGLFVLASTQPKPAYWAGGKDGFVLSQNLARRMTASDAATVAAVFRLYQFNGVYAIPHEIATGDAQVVLKGFRAIDRKPFFLDEHGQAVFLTQPPIPAELARQTLAGAVERTSGVPCSFSSEGRQKPCVLKLSQREFLVVAFDAADRPVYLTQNGWSYAFATAFVDGENDHIAAALSTPTDLTVATESGSNDGRHESTSMEASSSMPEPSFDTSKVSLPIRLVHSIWATESDTLVARYHAVDDNLTPLLLTKFGWAPSGTPLSVPSDQCQSFLNRIIEASVATVDSSRLTEHNRPVVRMSKDSLAYILLPAGAEKVAYWNGNSWSHSYALLFPPLEATRIAIALCFQPNPDADCATLRQCLQLWHPHDTILTTLQDAKGTRLFWTGLSWTKDQHLALALNKQEAHTLYEAFCHRFDTLIAAQNPTAQPQTTSVEIANENDAIISLSDPDGKTPLYWTGGTWNDSKESAVIMAPQVARLVNSALTSTDPIHNPQIIPPASLYDCKIQDQFSRDVPAVYWAGGRWTANADAAAVMARSTAEAIVKALIHQATTNRPVRDKQTAPPPVLPLDVPTVAVSPDGTGELLTTDAIGLTLKMTKFGWSHTPDPSLVFDLDGATAVQKVLDLADGPIAPAAKGTTWHSEGETAYVRRVGVSEAPFWNGKAWSRLYAKRFPKQTASQIAGILENDYENLSKDSVMQLQQVGDSHILRGIDSIGSWVVYWAGLSWTSNIDQAWRFTETEGNDVLAALCYRANTMPLPYPISCVSVPLCVPYLTISDQNFKCLVTKDTTNTLFVLTPHGLATPDHGDMRYLSPSLSRAVVLNQRIVVDDDTHHPIQKITWLNKMALVRPGRHTDTPAAYWDGEGWSHTYAVPLSIPEITSVKTTFSNPARDTILPNFLKTSLIPYGGDYVVIAAVTTTGNQPSHFWTGLKWVMDEHAVFYFKQSMAEVVASVLTYRHKVEEPVPPDLPATMPPHVVILPLETETQNDNLNIISGRNAHGDPVYLTSRGWNTDKREAAFVLNLSHSLIQSSRVKVDEGEYGPATLVPLFLNNLAIVKNRLAIVKNRLGRPEHVILWDGHEWSDRFAAPYLDQVANHIVRVLNAPPDQVRCSAWPVGDSVRVDANTVVYHITSTSSHDERLWWQGGRWGNDNPLNMSLAEARAVSAALRYRYDALQHTTQAETPNPPVQQKGQGDAAEQPNPHPFGSYHLTGQPHETARTRCVCRKDSDGSTSFWTESGWAKQHAATYFTPQAEAVLAALTADMSAIQASPDMIGKVEVAKVPMQYSQFIITYLQGTSPEPPSVYLFWNGTGWATERPKALVFGDSQDAQCVLKALEYRIVHLHRDDAVARATANTTPQDKESTRG